MTYKVKFQVYNRFNHLIVNELKTLVLTNPTVGEIKELVNQTKYGNVESEVFVANGGRNDLIHLDVVNDPWVAYKIYLN